MNNLSVIYSHQIDLLIKELEEIQKLIRYYSGTGQTAEYDLLFNYPSYSDYIKDKMDLYSPDTVIISCNNSGESLELYDDCIRGSIYDLWEHLNDITKNLCVFIDDREVKRMKSFIRYIKVSYDIGKALMAFKLSAFRYINSSKPKNSLDTIMKLHEPVKTLYEKWKKPKRAWITTADMLPDLFKSIADSLLKRCEEK